MAPRNSGALVVGYRREDERRFERTIPATFVAGVFIPRRTVRLADFACNRVGGKCVSCNRDVYLNDWGMSAVLEKDADVACMECESLHSADITRSL